MSRDLRKSKKIIAGAMETAATAIVQIDKAITVLEDSIAADERRFDHITAQISVLEHQLEEISCGLVLKKDEINKHNRLKESITDFINGGNN